MAGLTYRTAGVDIAAGNRFVDLIRPLAASTRRPGVIGGIGGFSGLFRLDRRRYRDPLLVAGTDGVGTKLKLAFELRRHETVGIDLVAMSVNDLIVTGAEPLFFLDYFAAGKLDPDRDLRVLEGIAEGCRQAGCALLGGETAEMPGLYANGEYDLAGFAVGVVERRRLIDGKRIRPGDLLIGLASSGPHSNGYSLIRAIVARSGVALHDRPGGWERPLGETLLTPTRIYARSIRKILPTVSVKGMAHITGGGITGNLPRILPSGVRALVRRGSWSPPPVFSWLERVGRVDQDEMYRVFNMGVGLVLVVAPADGERLRRAARRAGETAFTIGEIRRGRGDVEYA